MTKQAGFLPGAQLGQGDGHFLCWDQQCSQDRVHMEPQKVQTFSSCSEWGLLFVAVPRLLIEVASLVAEHGLEGV